MKPFQITKTIIILVLIFISGCTNHQNKINTNKIHFDYYKNGNIHFILIPKNAAINDSLMKAIKLDTIKAFNEDFTNKYFCLGFLKNGKLNSKGFCDSLKIRVGIWTYYKNKKPFADIEYIDYLGKQIHNRTWGYYKKDTDTCIDNLYYIAPKNDTLLMNKLYRFKIFLTYPFFSSNSQVLLLLPRDSTGKALKNKRFFELNYPVKFDTFENIETLRKKTGQKPDSLDNHCTVVDISFSSKGKKVLNGILLEKYIKNDSTYYKELFFSKEYYIKDTVMIPRRRASLKTTND